MHDIQVTQKEVLVYVTTNVYYLIEQLRFLYQMNVLYITDITINNGRCFLKSLYRL